MDSQRVFLIGGTIAAVFVGAYILWGPTSNVKKHRNRKDRCPGLVNLGNTCFLNAILQSLASSPSFAHWICRIADKQMAENHEKSLAHTLCQIIKVLNNQTHAEEPFCPSDVIQALRAQRWVISPDEHDAHELFHVITECLDDENAQFPSLLSLFDTRSLQQIHQLHDAISRFNVILPKLYRSDHVIPFKGLFASQLMCETCHFKSPVKYDTFDSLSLMLPSKKTWGTLTLQKLLQDYICCECVQNVECENCAKLLGVHHQNPKRNFMKNMSLGKLPDSLCIHIQRTVWMVNGMPTKRFEHVAFPEILQMDGFSNHGILCKFDEKFNLLIGGKDNEKGRNVSVTEQPPMDIFTALNCHSRSLFNRGFQYRNQNQIKLTSEMNGYSQNSYKLSSVIMHIGDVLSGHFVTYRRGCLSPGQPLSDKWYYTSDSVVKLVGIDDVLTAEAYMLFYHRVLI